MHTITFLPLGNADCCRIDLADGQKILFDYANTRSSDDPTDKRIDLAEELRARPNGTKELVALEDGYRESTDSWAMVLRALKRQGMRAPMVAVGDGALGFWAAVRGGLAGDGRAARLVPQAGECARR